MVFIFFLFNIEARGRLASALLKGKFYGEFLELIDDEEEVEGKIGGEKRVEDSKHSLLPLVEKLENSRSGGSMGGRRLRNGNLYTFRLM